MKHVIFGTAGHIDHGKSALVMALTGTDPDRWEEEKRRGITIDLGFAHFDSGAGLRIALIDVPGHERFVRNMLAGATGIDAVLLVIAADESIKPQTREHFEICRLLGVQRGLTVITKRDLVDAATLDRVRVEVQAFVAGSFLEGTPVVAVSARTGEGLDTLKQEMAHAGSEIATKPATLPFRLPVDRAFAMKGFGAVVTGTLIAGKIGKDSAVEIFPLARRVRVRGIQAHNQPVREATAGQRTALNLAGIDAKDIHRGMMLAQPDQFRSTDRLDCTLSLLPTTPPLKNRARVHFHCWTSEMLAEVVLLEGGVLRPGESAYVQLRLVSPGLFLPGDHFIIRQFSPAMTIGGGRVLDNFPSRAAGTGQTAHQFLEALNRGDAAERVRLLVGQAKELGLPEIAARTGWEQAEVLRVATDLGAEILRLGEPPNRLLDAGAASALSGGILQILTRFHAANPLSTGMPKEELRGQARWAQQKPSAAAFNAVVELLRAERSIHARDESVSLAGHEVRLSPAELAAQEQIIRSFESAGLRAPAMEEVLAALRIDRSRAEALVQILLKEKTLVKIGDGLVFHRSALESLRRTLAKRKAQGAHLSVPDFKSLTGVSRKYAIPLLEYLDRERVTRRSGSERVIL